MKNVFLNLVIVFAIIFSSANNIYAATCTAKSPGGNWNTASNWTCGSVPSGSDIVVIDYPMTISGNTTLSAFSGTVSITINNGGSLKVTGNLTLQGASINVIVNSGGTLEVTGTLTTQNGGAKVTVNNGGTLKAGTLAINFGSTVATLTGATATIGALTVSSNSDAVLNNTGTMNISGSVTSNGVINNYGTMNVGGNLTQGSSGNMVTNSGILSVTGNVVANGKIQLNPGVSADSRMLVGGNFTVTANENLVVGTNVSPPSYADLVVKMNLVMSGSGDVTINKNGRVGVFGNVTDSGGGGTFLKINAGGQMYVDGSISFSGGGNNVINNNTSSPFGLYVNGSTTNTGGGSTTTTNKADKSTMQTTNPTFANWVTTQSNVMPISLLFFKVNESSSSGVLLNWVTVSEFNFDYFEVERSFDGLSFQAIGRIKGNGTTTVRHEYAWRDTSPFAGRNYYRLKSVDFDGYSEYFNVVAAVGVSERKANIYPNPVSDGQVHIDLTFSPENEATLFVTDLSGSTVVSQRLEERSIVLPLSVLPGVYLVTIISGDFKSVSRLMVR